MVDLLVAARAVHFAATVLVAGVMVFRCLIVDLPELRRRLADIVWMSLALALLSGATWLFAVTTNIGGANPAPDMVLVLTRTQFGHAWLLRLLLALGLLAGLTLQRRTISALLAAGFVGSLAWSGHAAGTPGAPGALHVVADFLHLVAAAAWLGGLLPLFLLLKLRHEDGVLVGATRRFSTLGLVSVGTLLATGSINAWLLVPNLSSLIEADYGRLLLVKIALFVAMVVIAAVNRFRLTPCLSSNDVSRQLARNALAEFTMGGAVLIVVSVLGVLPPMGHMGLH